MTISRFRKPVNKKLYIKTMGCQMNQYDSEKMADILRESHGYQLTASPEDADLLLVNTCSIRERRRRRSFPNSAAGGRGRKNGPKS